jgi:hypothetical protein
MKISATIITYNEERNIARAIESLRCADEILVRSSIGFSRSMPTKPSAKCWKPKSGS